MNPKVKYYLLKKAELNPHRFKMAAAIHINGRILSVGINQTKTHPLMMNDAYREHQVCMHAEVDAIRQVRGQDLSGCTLSVVRVKRSKPNGPYVEAMAKPCEGCMSVISSFGIEQVDYTTGD